eukprot:4465160-Prymnesium_polylepis.1
MGARRPPPPRHPLPVSLLMSLHRETKSPASQSFFTESRPRTALLSWLRKTYHINQASRHSEIRGLGARRK